MSNSVAPIMTDEQRQRFNDRYEIWQWNEKVEREYTKDKILSTDCYSNGSDLGVRTIKYYRYNTSTGQHELSHYDVYVINEKGETVPDYKQGDYSNVIMNNEWKTRDERGQIAVVKSRNTISQQGCYISSIADVATYYGNKKTPEEVDALADTGKYYISNSPELSKVDKLIEDLGGKVERVLNSTQFRTKIEERISQGKPTIIKLVNQNDPSKTHFAVVSGARYNASGELTQYLLSDPGIRNSDLARINPSNLSYARNINYYLERLILYDK